ncbi:LytR/AlgR family response regulator transcription factor [Parachryseolinea silvisoli]|uniref:LytR/AlgR family response regulator transcription factor n=1 Tax=Parachryseolinea silvisoli TaxID=2873601 RepID=UPI00295E93D0|nr:LytTR family DNA-binding domain-containing protein [Parachryseolinea silvisoli]
MMTAIAVDDEPIALDVVKSLAAKVPFLVMQECFTDAFAAMDYLQRNTVDLLFLDIKMPDITGIDFLKSLNKMPLVIFTTAYSEHAVASFELDAVDYLLKPFSLARFMKACNKAHELYGFRNAGNSKEYMFLKTGYEQVRVLFNEIEYLEAAGNYITFKLHDREVVSRMTMVEVENLLPTGKFVRIHRSFVIAIAKIEKIERHQVTLRGRALPVGGAYLPNLEAISKQ